MSATIANHLSERALTAAGSTATYKIMHHERFPCLWSIKNICQSCMKAADPKTLFQYVEFLADFYECCDTLVELLEVAKNQTTWRV